MPETRPPDAPPPGPTAARRLVLVLVVAAVLFGAAYFLGGLEPVPRETTEVADVPAFPSGEPPPETAPADTVIDPEDLPGFETAHLTNGQRLWLYHRAHLEECGCGCGMTVAQCRVEDPTCPESPGRARELVREAEKAVPRG